jgi:hypothetical protein
VEFKGFDSVFEAPQPARVITANPAARVGRVKRKRGSWFILGINNLQGNHYLRSSVCLRHCLTKGVPIASTIGSPLTRSIASCLR